MGEVIVSGKLRAQRAKGMKFRDGFLISTGEPKRQYIDEAVRHVAMRQGMIGIKVKIMLAHDPEGKMGPKMTMPDAVIIHSPNRRCLWLRLQSSTARVVTRTTLQK